MATMTMNTQMGLPQRSFRNLMELFAKEAKYEVVKNIRCSDLYWGRAIR